MSSSNPPTKYINQGLNHWKQQRKEWLRNTTNNNTPERTTLNQPRPINFEVILDSIYPTSGSYYEGDMDPSLTGFVVNGKGVSLSGLVLILNELWEVEKEGRN